MLLIINIIFFTIYFIIFNLIIHIFNLKTPNHKNKKNKIITKKTNNNTKKNLTQLTTNYITAINNTNNLKTINTYITHLHLTITNSTHINNTIYKHLNASKIIKLNKQTIQIIINTKTKSINNTIKKIITHNPITAASTKTTPTTTAPITKPQTIPNTISITKLISPITNNIITLNQIPNKTFTNKTINNNITIKPTNKIIISPTAKTIIKIFNTNHTFYLKTKKNTKIIIHININTITLKNKNFKHLIKKNTQINTKQPILKINLNYLNTNTHSIINPIIYSNINNFNNLIIKTQNHIITNQTPLYKIKK